MQRPPGHHAARLTYWAGFATSSRRGRTSAPRAGGRHTTVAERRRPRRRAASTSYCGQH